MHVVMYQAASAVAHSMRINAQPPLEALETLASNHQQQAL